MPDPMWRRIAEDLRQKIESGELGRDGAALPSELELRDQYGASRNTIRDAVKWVITRSLVVTRPGHGTFARQRIDPFVTPLSTEIGAGLGGESAGYAPEPEAYTLAVTARSREPEVSVPRVEIQQAVGMIADELRLEKGVTVLSRHQERRIDGIPWSLQTSFYPMSFFERGGNTAHRSPTYRGRGSSVYREGRRHQAGRLAGEVHRTLARSKRDRIFRSAG